MLYVLIIDLTILIKINLWLYLNIIFYLPLQREQNALRAAEEQRKLEEKYRKQRETRERLDFSLQLKMKKKAKEEQEELAFDLKMLEQLLEESRNEAMEQMQRKVCFAHLKQDLTS